MFVVLWLGICTQRQSDCCSVSSKHTSSTVPKQLLVGAPQLLVAIFEWWIASDQPERRSFWRIPTQQAPCPPSHFGRSRDDVFHTSDNLNGKCGTVTWPYCPDTMKTWWCSIAVACYLARYLLPTPPFELPWQRWHRHYARIIAMRVLYDSVDAPSLVVRGWTWVKHTRLKNGRARCRSKVFMIVLGNLKGIWITTFFRNTNRCSLCFGGQAPLALSKDCFPATAGNSQFAEFPTDRLKQRN